MYIYIEINQSRTLLKKYKLYFCTSMIGTKEKIDNAKTNNQKSSGNLVQRNLIEYYCLTMHTGRSNKDWSVLVRRNSYKN